jgi:hypothetical protein
MSELRGLKRRIVSRRSREDTVALLASAGIDSVSTGIVCQEVGKTVHAYTYELQGFRSREREKVEAIARHLGWRLHVITVPTQNLAADFKRLAIQYRCRTKVQFEVTFPLLYVFPEIEEREVWTGFNADDNFGNTRKPRMDQARLKRDGVDAAERKRLFDEHRKEVYEKFDRPHSDDTWWFAEDVCQRWGREVEANPDAFAAELEALPPQPRANTRLSRVEGYRPYMMADVLRASAAGKFTAISTFAGGGGSSTGYRLAGAKVLLVNEFVPEAARTYKTNFPDCVVDRQDIREISASDETVAAFLALVGLKRGELDLLDGSPPCCEFSTAGRGIGDQDVLRPYSDLKQSNIASLPFDLVDLVIKVQPKVFTCENVPAFASRGAEVFHRVLRALRFPADRSDRGVLCRLGGLVGKRLRSAAEAAAALHHRCP